MGIFSFVKAGGKKFGSIVGTGPKVNKTDLEKAKSSLEIQKHKTKMSGAKLGQTNFEIKNPKFSKGDYTFDPGKKNVKKTSVKNRNKKSQEMFEAAKGRKELKDGSKKSDFGAQSVKYGLDKNYSVTKADRIAKFVSKKNKKKVI